jgi:hypothetical protein
MANPLFDQLGGNVPQQASQQPNDGGFGAMLAQFQQFCQQYKGNPSAEIDQLVKSGKVTQAQVDQARQMAAQMMRLLPHK